MARSNTQDMFNFLRFYWLNDWKISGLWDIKKILHIRHFFVILHHWYWKRNIFFATKYQQLVLLDRGPYCFFLFLVKKFVGFICSCQDKFLCSCDTQKMWCKVPLSPEITKLCRTSSWHKSLTHFDQLLPKTLKRDFATFFIGVVSTQCVVTNNHKRV